MKRPDSPGLREVLRGLRAELDAAGIESPDAEAERLLAHVLGIDRARLALEGDAPLPVAAAAGLARLVARRTTGEPLQHLEGTVAFRDLLLRADGRALIPRPETEQLVDLVARKLRTRSSAGGVRTVARPGASPSASVPPVEAALDVGTGGGAIALSLVTEGLASRVIALDVSEPALAQARENRELCGVGDDRVELRLTGPDPFDALSGDERFELLVCNPPYVRNAEIEGLPVEIRDYEPRTALAGGTDGLDLVRTIVGRAPDCLVPGAILFIEIGAEQGPAASALFEESPDWEAVDRHRDLAGRERFLTARRR